MSHDILFDKNNTTRYSGPQIMGFNDQKILDELVSDIPFQPFSITVNKLSIIIHSIGISSVEAWHSAGKGFAVSLVYNYAKDRAVFYCGFNERAAFIEI